MMKRRTWLAGIAAAVFGMGALLGAACEDEDNGTGDGIDFGEPTSDDGLGGGGEPTPEDGGGDIVPDPEGPLDEDGIPPQ